MTTIERSLQMRLASYKSWANTTDRSARTAAAREASHHTRFIEQARTQHPQASDAQIADIAAALRKAHYTDLALRSAQARRIKRDAARAEHQRRVTQELAAAEATASSRDETAA
jgi:hypothetical protein